MKLLSVGLIAFGLLGASAVYAGGGCNYGHAKADPVAEEEMDPKLLALLKKQEEEAARQEAIVIVPN